MRNRPDASARASPIGTWVPCAHNWEHPRGQAPRVNRDRCAGHRFSVGVEHAASHKHPAGAWLWAHVIRLRGDLTQVRLSA